MDLPAELRDTMVKRHIGREVDPDNPRWASNERLDEVADEIGVNPTMPAEIRRTRARNHLAKARSLS